MRNGLFAVVLVILCVLPAAAQSSLPHADAKTLEQAGLTKDVEIGRLKIVNAQLTIRASQAEAQLSALSAAFDALLKGDAQRTGQAIDTELKPSHDAIVKALGGDPVKGDTFDFIKGVLVKKAEPPKDVK